MAPKDPLDDFITAAAGVLALPIDPAWRRAVRARHLGPLARSARDLVAPWRGDVALRIAYALERAGVAAAPTPSL